MEDEEVKPNRAKSILMGSVPVVVVAVIAVAVLLLTPKSSPGPSNDANSTTQNTSTDKTAGVATIIATTDGFSPTKLTVKKGTIVTVENQSSESIQFSSGEHPSHKDDPEINMGVLGPGQEGTFTVTVAGTHSFHDHLHDKNMGEIIVTD